MKKSIFSKTLFIIIGLMTIIYVISFYITVTQDKEIIKEIQNYNLSVTNKALDTAHKNNLKNTKKDLSSYVKIIAKNYSIFLLNYDIDGLKSNVILSMNKKYIKAIKIIHTTDDEVLLLAINNKSNIQFINKLPYDIEKYEKYKSNIVSKDDFGNLLKIGKVILYYDKTSFLNKINQIKNKSKEDIKNFNDILNNKLEIFIINKLIIELISLIIMFLLIASVLKKFINNPLQKLHLGMNNFFSYLKDENISIKEIDINTHDEFGQMAYSLNENIKVSSKLHKQIKELNLNLEERILEKTQELQEKEETYKALFYKSADGILLLKDNIIIDCNDSAIQMLEVDNLISMPHDYFFPEYQNDNIKSNIKMQEYILESFKTGVCRFEWMYKKSDENITWVEIVLTKITLFKDSITHIVIRDINNKKILERNLIKEKEKAEESTKLKSEFLANMSHEIRTPMNGILGMTYLILQTELKNKQKNYIEKIDKSAKNLLGIINDILDFSKIEAGKLKIEETKFNMYKLIDDIINIFEYKIHDKNLELIVDYDCDMNDTFYGDNLRISQIITNLLSNAIKFTHKGEICIRIKKINNDFYRFEISDTGIGLSPNDVKKLFKSFSQADSSITRKYGGTGLGLKISKQLVELMFGKIYVKSELGIGSKFIFEIPLKEIEKTNKFNKFSNKKILIIDDNQSWHDIIENILKIFDVNIEHAFSGDEAIDKICNQNIYYDLLLIDWNMPNLDGIETVKIINERSTIHPKSIIMISSFRLESVIKLSKDVGISTFLQKPINPSLLNDILSSIFFKNEEIIFKNRNNKNLDKLKQEIVDIKNYNILLTEDNYINQEIIIGLLEDTNINIDIAFNGKEAVDLIKNNNDKYSLILMDLQMPIMDGYEATKIIRSFNKTIPIVALTANAMESDILNTQKVGMNDHLNKPIDIVEFFKVIIKYSQKNNINKNVIPIKILDQELGLKYLLGNEKLYFKIIKQFYVNYKDINFMDKNQDELRMTIHTVKGLSLNIGAVYLHDATIEIEKEINNKIAFNNFIIEFNKVIDHLELIVN